MWINDEYPQLTVRFKAIPSGVDSPSIGCSSTHLKSIRWEVVYWSKADWEMFFEYGSP